MLYVKTNAEAPQYKLITIDISGDTIKTQDLIPEDKKANLVEVDCVNGDTFAVVYKRNVNFILLYWSILPTVLS